MSTSNAKELRDLLRCPHMHGLKELSLDDNELESEGAVFISEGIQVLPQQSVMSENRNESKVEMK